MGSVLSSAYAALCSFVSAQFDKAEMRRLMAAWPELRDMPAEEREAVQRWLWDQEAEQDARKAAVRFQGRDQKLLSRYPRCNYRHQCYRVDADKNKSAENL